MEAIAVAPSRKSAILMRCYSSSNRIQMGAFGAGAPERTAREDTVRHEVTMMLRASNTTMKNVWRMLCNASRNLLAVMFFLGCVMAARGQNQNPVPTPSSDLARANLSQVGASAGDIKAYLTDPALMVALKLWIAKDATDQGQLISESDLTDDAIFERLETDVRFRSAATQLLQRYGYLVPQINPGSQAGREQEFLIQERLKWIAQHEEEDRRQEDDQAEQALKLARSCEQGVQADCGELQKRPSSVQSSGQQIEPGQAPPVNPNPPSPRNLQPGGGGPLERAQLMQTGQASGADFYQLGFGNSPDSTQTLGDLGDFSAGISSSLMQQMGNTGNLGMDLSTNGGGNGGFQGDMTGLSLNGTSLGNSNNGYNSSMDTNQAINSQTGSAAGRNSSSMNQWQQPYRGNQERLLLQPVEMIRAANPYNDIPSLYDMYMQAVPRPAVPRRFGIDVFENESQDSRYLPMDLPVGPDYVVGPGDSLAVDMWGGVSRRLVQTVDREGRISLPEVGPVLVSGKSLADVQQNIQQVLRTEFRDVSADVSLSRLRTVRIYDVGDISNPGAYDISSLSTPLNALFAAGGPTARGSLRIVKHYRGNQLVEVVDLYDLLLHGMKGDIQRLENGDTVLVPPIGSQVTVEGMVRRPAIYELKDEKNLASVLELAGGMLPAATLRHIEVQRLVAHQKQTMLSLDITDADDLSAATKKLESFEIQDGDLIRVFPIASGNEDAVYLEGHVIRPGRYSYRADMRVTDVVASYKDLLPEPASSYAEIIRLNAPDFHPTVESFDLASALASPSQSPVLHPMDTVRIFGRYDFENPPTVSVLGDVRQPGTFRTSGQIHLSDAVHLAGGLAPDAQTVDAQVFRYMADGKTTIFSVNLSGALAGDPAQNILLESRDRLLIHQSASAVQPAAVYIEGEVGKPGRYPLTTNLTVAGLIRVGGGLKDSANLQSADLTRYAWTSENQFTSQHEAIAISAALMGDPNSDASLHNGDVLTIGQLPGWEDLGASITLKGEVRHPGKYGIKPGERLSSVIERAGGFEPDAYSYGAVLQRIQVRELEAKQQNELILRVKDAQNNLESSPETDPKEKEAKETALIQYQTTLTQLTVNPPLGRVNIRISPQIDHWKNTNADIEARAGDTLVIPKRPSYVMITGQVFNSTAVSYRPGRSASWYLQQSGGPTSLANKKAIFVIRADGSVIGTKSGLWSGESLSAVLLPGDTVVVPERAIGGNVNWQVLFTAAQVASSIASTAFIAAHY